MVKLEIFCPLWAFVWICYGFVNASTELQRRYQFSVSENSTISVKGISIGGWLTTEPYITPSLYQKAFNISSNASQIVDEYTLTKVLGYDTARQLLEDHFESWITEDDFQKISEDGFNLVRIPIGYWAWKKDNVSNTYVNNITFEDPYVSDGLQLQYLEKALDWAKKYDLNVWIDLHGAPNTQNGFDNSGERNLYSDLSWLKTDSSRKLTLAIWESLFETYLDNNAVVGIEIMNEPLSPKLDVYTMTEYYYKAFELYKQYQENDDNTTFVIHDAFEEINYWNLYLNPNYNNVTSQYADFNNITFQSSDVLVDHHHYEVFTDFQLNNNQTDRVTDIINYGESIAAELSYHPAIVGEFSAAITDCASWINGVGIGSRYDGSYYKTTNFTTDYEPLGECKSQLPVSNWTQEYKEYVRQFVEAQLVTYSEKTNGWIFWNWKTESATEWDYLKLKENGLFPSPLDNYTYFQSNGNMQTFFSTALFPQSSTSSAASATTTSSRKTNGAGSFYNNLKLSDNRENMSFIWKSTMLAALVCAFAIFNIM